MDPDDGGRAILLGVPLLLLGVGVGAAFAAGVSPRVLLPGAAGMLVVAGALYYYAGQVVGLAGDERSTETTDD